MASGMSNAEAAQVGAKTLWIGDIEQWMDENYVISLFQGVINIKILTLYRLHKCNKLNLLEINLREHLSVSLISLTMNLVLYRLWIRGIPNS